MRALVVESGEVELREVPGPTPAAGEALIRVHLAGICGTDLEILRGYAGFQGILGHEFVGTVTAGPAALKERRVVGEINCPCGKCDLCAGGLSNHCQRRTVVGIVNRPGVFAEYVCLPARNCLPVPETVSDEEAVFAEPLAAAYQIVRQVKLEPRSKVTLIGTGRLGLLAAQVLRQAPCALAVVGRNPRTLDLLDRKGIRAMRFEDLRKRHDQDVVVDCTGSPEGLTIAMQLVRPRGTIVLKTTCKPDAAVDLSPLVVDEVTLLGSRCGPLTDAVAALARKQIDTASLITARRPLSAGVEALALAAQPEHIKVLLRAGE